MKKLVLAALLTICGAARATPVQDVADPRPLHHVVDETGALTPEDVVAIDQAAKDGGAVGELLVVVVSSTNGAVPREWTRDLFNRFALDTKKRNKGILLMAALGDRKAEIVIGDGWAAETTRTTDDVMRSVVVAHMKRGDPRGAIVEAARALSLRLLQDPAAMEQAAAQQAEEEALQALVAKVPDPRKARGAVDRTKTLTAADQKEIAKVRAAAADMTLAVVVLLKSERDAKAVSEAIFDRYMLDGDRGVLLVFFADTANPKIIAGPAFPAQYVDEQRSRLGVAFTAALQDGALPGTALVELTRSLSRLGVELPAWQEAKARTEAEAQARRDAERQEKRRADEAQMKRNRATSEEAAFARETRQAQDRMIFAGGGAGLLGAAAAARLIARHRRRKCSRCGNQMDRLSEAADDDHLTKAEQKEEELGSVDYDVWHCSQCENTVKTKWFAILTGYSTCPKCAARTLRTKSRTISAATYTSTGTAEVTRNCEACPFRSTERRIIPRKRRSSSGSRSSSSGSRSSGGGGSSSGRGSSGSW